MNIILHWNGYTVKKNKKKLVYIPKKLTTLALLQWLQITLLNHQAHGVELVKCHYQHH